MLEDLLKSNRSYRRFYQDIRIRKEELEALVGLVRWCASGRNAQPLKYALIYEENACAQVFPLLAWAGYLKDWAGPEEGERPTAYLVQMLDTRIAGDCLCDDGIQAQTLLLGAVERGFGGCMIKAFKNEALREVLSLPDYLKILYVIALGKPKEQVILEEMKDGDYKYWRDVSGKHHVPKRNTEDLIYRG